MVCNVSNFQIKIWQGFLLTLLLFCNCSRSVELIDGKCNRQVSCEYLTLSRSQIPHFYTDPDLIGDGECNKGYNITECYYDGGDVSRNRSFLPREVGYF